MSTPRERATALRAAQRAAIRTDNPAVSSTTTDPTTLVDKVCRKCFGHAVSKKDMQQLTNVAVTSTGTAHAIAETDPTRTECGRQIPDTWTLIR